MKCEAIGCDEEYDDWPVCEFISTEVGHGEWKDGVFYLIESKCVDFVQSQEWRLYCKSYAHWKTIEVVE